MVYQDDVKAKAKEIRKAATKYRAKEVTKERTARLDQTDFDGGPMYPADAPSPPGDGIVYTGATGQPKPMPIVEGDKDWNFIYDAYAWIEEVWQPWADKVENPEDSIPIVEAFNKVAGDQGFGDSMDATASSTTMKSGGALGNSAMDKAGGTYSLVESSWEGAGADAFMQFISNVVPAQRNQIAMGRALRSIAVANHDMLEAIRKSVQDVQKDTLAAIEAQGGSGFSWNDVQTLLTIGGIAAAFTGGLAALPAVAAIGASAFGGNGQGGNEDEAGKRKYDSAKAQISIFGAGTLIKAFLPTAEDEASKKKLTLSADSVDGVLDKMADAISDMYDHRRDAEDIIIEKCTNNLQFIRDYDKNGQPDIDDSKPIVVAPRPNALLVDDRTKRKESIRPDGAEVPPSQR